MLGGIFDSPVKYLFDSENSIDLIGNWQKINQTNAATTISYTSDKQLIFKNSASSSAFCYGHTRNEIPINIKGYNYVYVHFTKFVYNYVSGNAVDNSNKIRIYVNPDLSNDTFEETVGTDIDIGEDTNFFNGTYVSGSKYEINQSYNDYTIEMDISAYSGKGGNFRIITTIGPHNSYMQIDKIYISRYKLT
jgi:hypothetical protein